MHGGNGGASLSPPASFDGEVSGTESSRASTCSSPASSIVSASSDARSNAASSASTTAASVSGSESTSLVAPDGSVPQLIADSTTPSKAPKRQIGIDVISYH